MRTYVIAEAGSCHDGDVQYALDLVAMAAEIGADAVKFQFWSDPDLLADRRKVPPFYRDFYRHYAVPERWLGRLAATAQAGGLSFMCTTFLPHDVASVAPLVHHFKVASFEADAADLLDAHLPFMREDYAAGRERWIVISRGMGSVATSGRFHPYPVRQLLCTSAYPAPAGELNLRRLSSGATPVCGLSDHSDPALTWTGALAVAAGAEIVEAHLRHHKTSPANPDFGHAMRVPQFRDYIRHIRFAETTLGNGRAQAQPSEAPMMEYRTR